VQVTDPTRRLAGPVVVGALIALAGCAGIPDSGPVHDGRPVRAVPGIDDIFTRFVVQGPSKHATPAQIVRGFVEASADLDGDSAVAREFLTPSAALRWHPQGHAAVYEDTGTAAVGSPQVRGQTRVVAFRRPMLGTLDVDGGYHRSPTGQLVDVDFRLVKFVGEWRIANPPRPLLLTDLAFARAYQPVDVYFLNRSLNQVVPDRVLLSVSSAAGLPTAAIRALLRGPTPALAPAVRSAFPRGTRLIGSAPVSPDGTIAVNLSREVLQAHAVDRQRLAAQLVWTVKQFAQVDAVQLLVEGAPLPVPGAQTIESRSAWPAYDPSGLPTDAAPVYRSGGRILTVGGTPVIGPLGTGSLRLTDVAVGPGVDVAAGLRRTSSGVMLYAGPLSSGPRPVLRAAGFTPPSIDAAGETWSVATGAAPGLRVVALDGKVERVAAPALDGRRVTRLRVSRDGARLAAVVGGHGRSRLLVGLVVVDALDNLRAENFRDVAPTLDISDVSWSGADALAVLGSSHGVVAPWVVTVDGAEIDPINTSGLAAYLAITAAPGHPLVVAFGPRVFQARAGRWHVVARGREPAYPG